MDALNKHRVLGELSYAQVDFNWDTLEGAVNTLEFRVPPSNWSATTNPTTADNAGQGWRNGSKWYNRNTGQYFICVDATAGTWVEDVDIDISSFGTAAFEDVTTSATDTAAGRLTRVGDFGVGRLNAVTLPVRNVDSVNNASGLWRVDGLDTGTKPWGGGGAAMLAVYVAGSVGAGPAQIVWDVNNLYHRGGVTVPWSRVYADSNILGAVSQSGGVPTGAVIERGSNANGTYVKFADGTMICTRNLGFQSLASPHTWTFPASFSTVTGLVPLVTTGRGDAASLNQYNVVPSVSSAAFYLSSAGQFTWQFLAIGRWF